MRALLRKMVKIPAANFVLLEVEIKKILTLLFIGVRVSWLLQDNEPSSVLSKIANSRSCYFQ